MRPSPCHPSAGLLLLTLAGLMIASAAEVRKTNFRVQLIRGSNSARTEDTTWKPVGPRLDKDLRGVFRWTNYWEVKRESIALSAGEVARLHLTRDREVEVKLLEPPNTQIRLFYRGELTRCSRQPITQHFCILGGDQKSGESWFVVVRRVDPPEPD